MLARWKQKTPSVSLFKWLRMRHLLNSIRIHSLHAWTINSNSSKIVDLQSACFIADTLQGHTRSMLPCFTRIHPDPKQPCFTSCSITGLRSSNAGTQNGTTQAELLDKMLAAFRLSCATIFHTYPELIHIPLFSHLLQETLVGSVNPSCSCPSLSKTPSHNPSTIHWKAQAVHQILARDTQSYSLTSQML